MARCERAGLIAALVFLMRADDQAVKQEAVAPAEEAEEEDEDDMYADLNTDYSTAGDAFAAKEVAQI